MPKRQGNEVMASRGVYEILIGMSVRDPDSQGKRYLIYNTVTDVVEEECWFAPQAYNYLESLSAEWDARVDSAALEKAERETGKVAAVASLRADKAYEH